MTAFSVQAFSRFAFGGGSFELEGYITSLTGIGGAGGGSSGNVRKSRELNKLLDRIFEKNPSADAVIAEVALTEPSKATSEDLRDARKALINYTDTLYLKQHANLRKKVEKVQIQLRLRLKALEAKKREEEEDEEVFVIMMLLD